MYCTGCMSVNETKLDRLCQLLMIPRKLIIVRKCVQCDGKVANG